MALKGKDFSVCSQLNSLSAVMFNFELLYFLSQILGIGVVISTVLWVVLYMGVVWDATDIQLYNWHAIFMVLGMVFFYGNCKLTPIVEILSIDLQTLYQFTAILVFRAFKSLSKLKVKIMHATFHGAAIFFVSFGLAVEFISHYHHGEPNLYSLHSWLGMATIAIFVGQFIFGFVCYLTPSLSEKIKAFYLPVHVFFGTTCFIMAITTCLIGLNQNARFNMPYYELPPEGILINLIGLMMVIYGSIVVFLVTRAIPQ